jgi:uncharacterized membrane protein YdjX (TVP38/TMEM64 family)
MAVLFLSLGHFFSFDQAAFESFFRGIPVVSSSIVFVVLYVVLTFFIWLGPKDIFRIVSALVYGPYLSTLLVWVAEAINVVVLFTMSRRLGRQYVEQKLKGRMAQLDETVSSTGFWSIFFLKLTPIVPFRFLDLGFGLTKISLKKYWTISALATPLRIFYLQFLLALGLETVLNPEKMTAYLEANPLVMRLCFAYLVLSVVVMLVWRKTKRPATSDK